LNKLSPLTRDVSIFRLPHSDCLSTEGNQPCTCEISYADITLTSGHDNLDLHVTKMYIQKMKFERQGVQKLQPEHDIQTFAPVTLTLTLTRWPWFMNATWIFWTCTWGAKRQFLGQGIQKLEPKHVRQTDRQMW